jgi:hypothetical protein
MNKEYSAFVERHRCCVCGSDVGIRAVKVQVCTMINDYTKIPMCATCKYKKENLGWEYIRENLGIQVSRREVAIKLLMEYIDERTRT